MKHVIVEKNNSYTFHEWWNKVPNAVCSNQYSVVFYNRIIPTNKINRDQFINLVKGSRFFILIEKLTENLFMNQCITILKDG